ncbi:hypothetical protein GCM10017687_59960 [Streptomyces echinatus]
MKSTAPTKSSPTFPTGDTPPQSAWGVESRGAVAAEDTAPIGPRCVIPQSAIPQSARRYGNDVVSGAEPA